MKLKNVISTAAAVVALSASGVLASDLTVVSWGGGYTASQQKAYGEPWEAKSGKKFTGKTTMVVLVKSEPKWKAAMSHGTSSTCCLTKSAQDATKVFSSNFQMTF